MLEGGSVTERDHTPRLQIFPIFYCQRSRFSLPEGQKCPLDTKFSYSQRTIVPRSCVPIDERIEYSGSFTNRETRMED
jgi:hypothetical protein